MATVSATTSAPPAAVPASPPVFPRVWISEMVSIPSNVVDLDSFCSWICSDEGPQRGQFSYLAGTIWVDLSMEEMYTHNQVKTEFSRVLSNLVRETGRGRFLADGMLIRNGSAILSTEPDGTFVSFQALQSGAVQRIQGARRGVHQLEGSPEMTLEVVSSTSVQKDTVELRDLYYKAGILEYWVVDVRDPAQIHFDILRHGARGYTTTRRQAGGWLRSGVFGKSFLLTQTTDPLGDPLYTLAMR
jgi:Uma2 family endonuclease